MKSKSSELLDKSIAAMISAIEIYNKPDFLYRGETFSIDELINHFPQKESDKLCLSRANDNPLCDHDDCRGG